MRIVYLFIVIIYPILLFCQDKKPEIIFDRISTENIKVERGLSQNSVFSILQDDKGYMWFGTWDGLNKFDGYNFTVYRANNSEAANQLSDETIYTIFEDEDQNLWIGTENGLNKFNRQRSHFVHFIFSDSLLNIQRDSVRDIIDDKKGNFWIGTEKGLYKFSEKKGKIELYTANSNHKNALSNDNVRVLYLQNEHTLWIGTEGGLNKLNIQTNEFECFCTKSKNKMCSDTVNDIVGGKKNILWIATANGLCNLNTSTRKIKNFQYNKNNPHSLSGNDVRALLYDNNNRLWIGTFGSGLNLYNNTDGSFFHYNYKTNDQSTLSSDNIYSLFQDDAGLIWVGTRKGVSKIDFSTYKFKHFKHHADDNTSLNSDIVWSFHEDRNGYLWICTSNGLNRYDKNTGKFKFYTHDPGNPNSIICNDTRVVYEDDSGYLWIGTNCKGLDKFDKNNEVFTHYGQKSVNDKLSSYEIWDILEDWDRNIWVATTKGLNKILPGRDSVIVYNSNSQDHYISNNLVYSLYLDHDKLWIGTNNGLNILDLETDSVEIFKQNRAKNSLSTSKLFSIYKDSDGIFWIGTINGGLNRYDPGSGIFKNFTIKDGLPNNMVYNILEDNSRNLWISTNFGISKYDKNSNVFVNYDVRDGLQSNEFNYGAALKTQSGEMFFGGMNGFNSFFPDNVNKSDYIPPVVITSFKVFNKEVEREINNNDSILLNYYNNFFSFEFSGLDFSKPNKNRYAYKLENFDKEWKYCNADKRFAQYTDINPGEYIFKVKCTNSDGVWNKKGIKIYLFIKPPWWKTLIFIIPASLFLFLLIGNAVYFSIRRIRKKHEMKTRMLSIEKHVFDLEQKSLRLQMNPHFIFNSLNSIQSFILANNRDKAVRYLGKFAKLMRLILYNTRQSFIIFTDELQAINYYLEIEKLRFDEKFDYEVVVDPKIDKDFIAIPPMLIQPFVENAILHGLVNKESKGFLEIKFSLYDQNHIQCEITDNGVGRQKAEEIKNKSGLKHRSRSMEITKERLNIIRKQNKGNAEFEIIDLFDENKIPKGTKVIIIIPYIFH